MIVMLIVHVEQILAKVQLVQINVGELVKVKKFVLEVEGVEVVVEAVQLIVLENLVEVMVVEEVVELVQVAILVLQDNVSQVVFG
jgi:hypothetical protein